MPSPETVEVLAQLSTDGAVTWLTTNWFKLALLIVAAGLFFAAMKQDLSKIFTVVAGVLVGIILLTQYFTTNVSPTAEATFIAGLILLGGHIAGHLLSRIGLPRITGYLGLGILLGPQSLAVIDPETATRLGFLKELAVAFIALAAGAELRLQQLRERIGTILSLTLSMAGFVSVSVFSFFFLFFF